ncbi:TPA: glycosyltransferase family 4 protein, partial [Escherichia coli]
MRLCFILPSLSKKGPNIVAYDIINELIKRNDVEKVDVYYFNDNNEGALLKFKVDIFKISFFHKIDFKKYDVVHCHMLKPDLYVFYHKCLNRWRFKSITTLHQLDYYNLQYDYKSKWKALVYSLLWRITLSCHNRIVCVSPSMINFYKKRLINRHILSVSNGRPLDNHIKRKYKNLRELKEKTVIGSLCGLNPRKGLEQILYAMVNHKNIHFRIAGEGGEKNNLIRLAKKLKVYNRVDFVGFVDERIKFLDTIDIFVLPSRAEGFPLALLEAMRFGLPCIASDIDVIRESFDSNIILQFKLDNIPDLENKIDAVIKSYDFYAKAA